MTDSRRICRETILASAASLLFLMAFFRLPLSDADEGIIVTGAERILRGQVPYRDFFSELGPASFYLQALIFKLSAVHVAAVRIPVWLLGGTISGLIYGTSRQILPAAGAGIAACIFTLVCYPITYSLSHHWCAHLFLFLVVLCLNPRRLQAGGALPWARLLVAGALTSSTLLAMQPKGIAVLLAGVLFLLLEPYAAGERGTRMALRNGLELAGWFLGGAVVFAGVVSCYFAYQGAFGGWVYDNFVFLLTRYRPYADVPQADAFQSLAREGLLVITAWPGHLGLHLVVFAFFLIAAPVIAFGGTLWQLYSTRHGQSDEAPMLRLYLLVGATAFFSEAHAPEVYHMVWAAPPMLGLLVYQWGRAGRCRHPLGRLAKAAALVGLACLPIAGCRKAQSALQRDVPVETRRGTVYVERASARDMQNIIRKVEDRVPPGGDTFFFPYLAELYFLTATHNPTRYDVLLPGFHTSSQIEEAVADLSNRRPEYVFSFDKIQRWTVGPHYPGDPPDVIGPHPVESALARPGSCCHLAESVASRYTTGFRDSDRTAVMEIWQADR